MKRSSVILILALMAGSFIPGAVKAGDSKFEGVISYKISFPNSSFPEEQLAMFPKDMTLSIKGTFSRNETGSAMGKMVEITDYAKKTSVSLLEMMGKKYAIRKNFDDINKDNAGEPKPEVELKPDTKQIAGYTCKKAVITTNRNGQKTTFEVWYTNELGSKEMNFSNPAYKDIDGMLMEFTLQERNLTMKYSAVSVEKKSLPDSLFEVPSDYTPTTPEELRALFGGGK